MGHELRCCVTVSNKPGRKNQRGGIADYVQILKGSDLATIFVYILGYLTLCSLWAKAGIVFNCHFKVRCHILATLHMTLVVVHTVEVVHTVGLSEGLRLFICSRYGSCCHVKALHSSVDCYIFHV